jgi:amino acid transporter
LFSPYYGYQTAGLGVIYSWGIVALITFLIGLSFAEMCSALPVAGGIYRLMSVTHNQNIASVFLIVGWMSYVVYLPLEAQAVIQYLGFWLPMLVLEAEGRTELSQWGVGLAMLIILAITWFNTLLVTRVAQANSLVSLWKILIPILVSLVAIISFGSLDNFFSLHNYSNFSWEHVLLAISSSGLAFAFSGFQNGLLLANQVKDPARAIPHSLFWPIVIGLILYLLISISYLATLNEDNHALLKATAPLLGLLSLLGLNAWFTLLFIDAVVSPLGTTNVYVAVTARILYGVGKELAPHSGLTRLNRNQVPICALWLNALVGMVFLFPFPTWKELVNFLSSIVVFAYLAGPIGLLVIRGKQIALPRTFSLRFPRIIGVLGFVLCGYLIYWSGSSNLGYLLGLLTLIMLGNAWRRRWERALWRDAYLLLYLGGLWGLSLARTQEMLPFPLDNLLVGGLSLIFCLVFVRNSLSVPELEGNIAKLQTEVALNQRRN